MAFIFNFMSLSYLVGISKVILDGDGELVGAAFFVGMVGVYLVWCVVLYISIPPIDYVGVHVVG